MFFGQGKAGLFLSSSERRFFAGVFYNPGILESLAMQMPLRILTLRGTQRGKMPGGNLPGSSTPWGTLLPALAAGLAAAGLAFLLVRGRLPAEAATPATVAVVVAARDIPARTRLPASALRLRALPLRDVPDGAAKSVSAFAGKVSVQPLPAGTPVTQSAVTAASAALGMAFALPPSLRAVTVATDPADGTELFVQPQDHVDILVTDEPGSGPGAARTVLQNVVLLAVGSRTSPDPPPSDAPAAPASGAAHVTVAVTPAQAQALVLAAARGHLHLALRADGDGGGGGGSAAPLPALPVPPPGPSDDPPPHPARPAAPVKIEPLPPLPALPPRPAPLSHVTITIIKGTLSQTVTVAP